jgi:hypothetical protein
MATDDRLLCYRFSRTHFVQSRLPGISSPFSALYFSFSLAVSRLTFRVSLASTYKENFALSSFHLSSYFEKIEKISLSPKMHSSFIARINLLATLFSFFRNPELLNLKCDR